MANQIAGTNIQIDLALQKETGAAQDLTGATLTWRLTRSYSVPGVLAKDNDLLTGVSLETDGTDGLVKVQIDPDDSLDLQGTYFHEIKADWGAGQEKTWQLDEVFFAESAVGAD